MEQSRAMAMRLIDKVEKEQIRHEVTFRPGDTVRVHVRIKEGDKERVQVFEGVVLSLRRPSGNRASFTVRKISYGVGVERIFPVHSPSIEKVEVVNSGKVQRARLYFLRQRAGKAARLKERDSLQVPITAVSGPDAEAPTPEA
jgi:large subunit ribosomal protein L19